ncbi:MAG: CooT family nickel-binding protein [Crenarchaeota archaeon]|nr:CooT family nickel-binding protein [Thermoproteota archaeon]
MCILTVRIVKDGKEEIIKDIIMIEYRDGKLILKDTSLREAAVLNCNSIKSFRLNTLDAYALLEIQ